MSMRRFFEYKQDISWLRNKKNNIQLPGGPVNKVLHLTVSLRLPVMVPLRHGSGGIAKCTGSMLKLHSNFH